MIADVVWNHNGFQYDDTPGFQLAGGYPGMVLQNPDGGSDPFGVPGTNGDFHSPYAGGYDARFGGLIDFDQAVYRASGRRNLDGSQSHVFSFMEAGDGPQGELLRRFVRKTIGPADPGRVGSNSDALDFNFLRAVKNNLSGNGLQNDWRSLVFASLDHHDDGAMNGSAGIKFVQSHDATPAVLNNVAHAYLLMLPGQAKVFFNAE